MSNEVSAAIKAQAQDLSIPAFNNKLGGLNFNDYTVKYYRANFDEPSDMLHLSDIETRGVRGDGVLIISRDKMSFMDRYYIIINYMEKNT